MNESRIPKLVQEVDLTALPIDPLDGFVLSRVDGMSTLEDLSDATGVSLERVTSILEKLAGLGAVTWGTPAPPRPPSRMPPLLGTPNAKRSTGRPPASSPTNDTPRRDPGRPKRPSGTRTPADLEAPTDFGLPSLDDDFGLPSLDGALSGGAKGSDAATEASLDGATPAAAPGDAEKPDEAPDADHARPPERRPSETPAAPADEASSAGHRTRIATPPPQPPAEPASPRARPSSPPAATHASSPDLGGGAVALDPGRRAQRKDLSARHEDLDHYAILGVPRSAEKKVIREAYFRLSKQFHPDTLYGKELGSYKVKMERVFKRLTEAYEVLGKKKRRGPYDEYLALKDQTAAIQNDLAQGAVVAERVATASRPPPALGDDEVVIEGDTEADETPSEMPAATAKTPSLDPEARRRRARDLLERRLRGATGHRRPASEEVDRPATSKEQVLRRLTNSLRDAAKLTGGSGRYESYVRAGDTAMEKDDLVTAVNSYRLALAMVSDPDPEVVERYEALRIRLATQMAVSYERQARYEEQSGRFEEAARSWLKVVDGRPDEVPPLRRAASALLKADGDLRKARDLAKRAVELAPDDIRGHELLARVFYAAGMSASAIQQLQTAAKLDPTNKTVKNLLAEMK